VPERATCACTIQDWVVARLCGEARPVTDVTDAASWGLFDLARLAWDANAVAAAGIPRPLLPDVVDCGYKAGGVCRAMAEDLGLTAGTPVAAAVGDNQASLMATLAEPQEEVALTLGTGGQLSAVMQAGFVPPRPAPGATFEYRPYPGRQYVAVAAALCGGAAWQWLAASVENWLASLGVQGRDREQLYAKLDELGLQAEAAVKVRPHLRGERHDPLLRGSIHGLSAEPLTLGNLARGLAEGIVESLANMLPPAVLTGRKRVVGSGNALRHSALLRRMAEKALGLPLVMNESQEEAACGAARLALGMLRASS